jgi:hypothetical protein
MEVAGDMMSSAVLRPRLMMAVTDTCRISMTLTISGDNVDNNGCGKIIRQTCDLLPWLHVPCDSWQHDDCILLIVSKIHAIA